MKVAKIAAFVLVGIVLLVVVVGAIALLPSVQTWAVRKAVAGQPGMKIEIGRVAAGFSSADIRDLRVEKDGMVITAKGATANYSAWDYITKKRIEAEQVTLEEVVVDLRAIPPPDPARPAGSNPSSAKDKASAAPERSTMRARAADSKNAAGSFKGALAQAQLPFDVRVGHLTAKGRALLAGGKVVRFDLQGAGIETGKEGKLEWKADFTDPQKTAALSAAQLAGTTRLHIASDRRIDLITVDASVSAQGPKLPADQVNLQAKAEQSSPGANESYDVTIALARGSRLEPLLKSTAEFRMATRDFAGGWELDVRSAQFAAVLADFGLPEVAAKGSGKFSFQPDSGAVSASGDLQGDLSHLEKIAPELAQIGAMQFRASFDGGAADNAARLERLQLDVTGADGRKFAQISTLQRIGFTFADKHVSLANPKAELARISIQALPLAWAQPFLKGYSIDSGDLSAGLAIEAEEDGSHIRVRTLEPLAVRSLTLRSGDKKLIDQLTLSASPKIDYSAARILGELTELKITMPAGDSLTGSLSADVTNLPTTPAIAFTSQLQARLVAAHRPYLPVDTGPLAATTSVQGRLAGDVLELAKLSVTVKRDAGAMLALVDLQQPVTANLKAGTFTVPKPDATVARVQLGEVPLAWAEPFVAKSKFAGALSGATLEISCRSVDDLTINTVEPIALRGATAAIEGKPMIQTLDLTANLTATKRKDVVTYEVRRLEIKQGAALLAGLTVAGEANMGKKLALAGKGNLEADAAALMNQPAAASFATLSRGRVTAAFEASVGDVIQARAVIAARGLVARQNNQPLGDLELTFSANVKQDGSGTLSAPITLSNGNRRSDLSIDGTFGKTSDRKSLLFSGKIGSNQLFVDDFEPLGGLAPAGEKSSKPTPAPKSKRDTVPFWKGVQGKVTLDLKKVIYGKDYTISGVHGTATITDSRLAFDGLEGLFNQNPFKANAGIVFNAQQAMPYALTASADVQNFDIGEFLRAASPGEKPALETKATVTARLNGNGGTVGDLAKNAFGKFELTGSKGVARYLARKGRTGQAVDILATGLAIFGAQKGSEGTMAVAELARVLNEVPFDSVKMQVERAADLSFKLTAMELISPILRMTGSGGVASRGTENLQNAPMNILLQLGAKGELAYLLQRSGMLGTGKDTQGYQLMTRTFTLGGTPSKPDSSALYKLLGEAVLGAFAR